MTAWLDLGDIILGKNRIITGQTLNDFFYMRHQTYSEIQKEIIKWWWPGDESIRIEEEIFGVYKVTLIQMSKRSSVQDSAYSEQKDGNILLREWISC